jgi:hypothetical protein
MSERIFIVIMRDRHSDIGIAVRRTRAGADAEIERFKAEYASDRDPYKWTEQTYGRKPGDPVGSWVRFVEAGDDRPSAYIQIGELAD